MTTAQEITRFREHSLWHALETVTAVAKAAQPRDSTSRHTLARVIATMQYAREFHTIDPHLLPEGRDATASSIESVATATGDQIEGWDQDGAMTAITVNQIDSYCTQVMTFIRDGAWPALFKESRARAISKAAAAFESAAEQSLDGLQKDVLTASEELESTRTDLTTLLTRAEQAQSVIDAANTNFSAEVEALRTRGDAQLAEVIDEVEGTVKESRDRQETAAGERLAQLEADAARGQELVKLIGDQAIGGGYDNFARAELQAYRFWSAVGVIISLGAAIYLFLALFVLEHINTLALAGVITRVALSLPVLAVAGYAFQQAGRRQRQSLEARYRALDVLAVEPFTKDMSDEQQTELRLLLGQRLFAAGPDAPKGTAVEEPALPSPAQTQGLLDLLKLFRPGS